LTVSGGVTGAAVRPREDEVVVWPQLPGGISLPPLLEAMGTQNVDEDDSESDRALALALGLAERDALHRLDQDRRWRAPCISGHTAGDMAGCAACKA
jgi:hypothetical protein